MKKQTKNHEIPVPEPRQPELEFPSASSGDMTGLIPNGITNDGEIESYGEVYPYLAERE